MTDPISPPVGQPMPALTAPAPAMAANAIVRNLPGGRYLPRMAVIAGHAKLYPSAAMARKTTKAMKLGMNELRTRKKQACAEP